MSRRYQDPSMEVWHLSIDIYQQLGIRSTFPKMKMMGANRLFVMDIVPVITGYIL